MNQMFRPPALPPTTQAAEGLMRRRWSAAEIMAMVEAGIIDENERFELIGGEVVPMASKGIRHETVKNGLNIYWAPKLPAEIRYAVATTFHMSEDTFVEPDFVFFRKSDGLVNLKPETALLAVEVADSSLGFDLGRKSRLYAAFAIREVWVINARTLVTHVMREPGHEGYASIVKVGPKKRLEPRFASSLSLKLAELELV